MPLAANQIHLWMVDLSTNPSEVDVSILSPDEKCRYQQFKTQPQQKRFLSVRTALRQILSRYLNIAAHEILFSYNQYGKPAVAMPNHRNLTFNLSHSQELAVIAIAKQQVLGIDIEQVKRQNSLRIAKRFFHANEYRFLAKLTETKQTEHFYQLWAKKEAFVKALGTAFPSTAKLFSLTPERDVETLFFQGQPWHIHTLQLHPNFKAAIVSDKTIQNTTLFSFNHH